MPFVSHLRIKPGHVKVFKKMSREKGLNTLRELDDWLMEKEAEAIEDGCPNKNMVSFSMYYYHNDNMESQL